jgi:hypothetical protein
MAWPWLAIVAKNVPWVELVRRAPDIIARSRELLDESKRSRPRELRSGEPAQTDLKGRIEALERRDAEHARIIAEMVEQLSGLVEAVRVLTARSTLLTAAVAILFVVDIVLLIAVLR